MLKSIKWVEDGILVIKVDESIYTLAQMRKNGLMEFFDAFREGDDWEGIDLNDRKILFCIFVAEKQLKSMFVRFLDGASVKKNQRPIIKEMLSFEWVSEGQYTANLIKLDEKFSSVGAAVIKSRLSVKEDIDIIVSHEFCGVCGDVRKLADRLRFYYREGINWDEQKKFIYPDIERPAGFPTC
ncbi:hypothetical protein [Pseudomonas abietaniphila]|uniref:hypothetical protein n=1 Tax=Pseudomonas abietaniphila TaxID=89065 RepID=UPI000781DD06|nr:hypothetical protein [Pseudomonas abietaniphila]